jgi:predicted Zn-dependent peptidase
MSRLPALGANSTLRLPRHTSATLPNGLDVLCVHRRGKPLVETRLRIPLGGAHLAGGRLLAQTVAMAAEGTLTAEADADRLRISGRALTSGLDPLLETLAGVLVGAPAQDLAIARDRLAAALRVAERRPDNAAASALARRVYRDHPYGLLLPSPADVAAVTATSLHALRADYLRPLGSTLIIVADLDPDIALKSAAHCLADWTGVSAARVLDPVPPLKPSALQLIDHPGRTQSSLRLAFPAVPRNHSDNAALRLANLVFGGYSGSRWTANLREHKGYAYGPRSSLSDRPAGSRLTASADVAVEHTAAALAETVHELSRLTCLPPSRAEVNRARDYTIGSLTVLGMSTHRDLADLAAGLVDVGLGLDYLGEYVERLKAASVAQVHEAALGYLAPSGMVAVLLADAGRVGRAVAALGPVTIGIPLP